MRLPWSNPPKDGRSRGQNLGTQPVRSHRVFNAAGVLTEGWYPACPSQELPANAVKGFDFLDHRVVVFRDSQGDLHALDAFCSHMGADLAAGAVVNDGLRCYFHRWRYAGDGSVVDLPCGSPPPPKAGVPAWPTAERYGWVWVFAGAKAPSPLPSPPGMEDVEVDAWHVGSTHLFVHHHLLMASGIDLAHFSSVHGLDVAFDFAVDERAPGVFDWNLQGDLPPGDWKANLGRALFGETFRYRVRFAGGSVCAITYGWDQRLFGTGPRLPPLSILWGCVPQPDGLSKGEIFLCAPKGSGWSGWVAARARHLATVLLLAVLNDEDMWAFPRMRFDAANPTPADASVVRLIQLINGLPISPWTPKPEVV